MDEIYQLSEKLQSRRMNCFKYNYALDSEVQNFTNFQSFLQLSEDGEELIITNRKPVEKMKYILESDPAVVKAERLKDANLRRSWEEEVGED